MVVVAAWGAAPADERPAAVRGLVQAVAGGQGRRAADLPGRLTRGPQHGEYRLRIRRVEDDVHAADILVLVEHLLPRRPAVGRAEHAALLVRAVRMPEHGDEHAVRVARIDQDGGICCPPASPKCRQVFPPSLDLYMPSPTERSGRCSPSPLPT